MASIISNTALSQNKKTISVETAIEAPASLVWEIISNNEQWSDWNPFITESKGLIKEGEKLKNKLLMDGKEYTFKPKVVEFKEGQSFSWKGQFLFPGIFDGFHSFFVIPVDDNRSKLIQSEIFSGLLSRMFMKKGKESTSRNFEAMNNAVKSLAEESAKEK